MTSRFPVALLCVCVAAIGAVAQDASAPDTQYQPSVRVYFSPATTPEESPTSAIVAALDAAKTSVHVQAYSFTSAPILAALKRAKERGVEVFVLLDKSNATGKYSGATYVINAGIPTGIDRKHAISHSKIMVIDGETVLTGSFNFTKAAENSNAENLLVLKDTALAARYEANWRDHAAHSDKVDASQIRSKGTTAKENRDAADAPDSAERE